VEVVEAKGVCKEVERSDRLPTWKTSVILFKKVRMYVKVCMYEKLDSRVVSALSGRLRKLSSVRRGQSLDGWPKFIISNSSVIRKAR
jgi:hypothetical protein